LLITVRMADLGTIGSRIQGWLKNPFDRKPDAQELQRKGDEALRICRSENLTAEDVVRLNAIATELFQNTGVVAGLSVQVDKAIIAKLESLPTGDLERLRRELLTSASTCTDSRQRRTQLQDQDAADDLGEVLERRAEGASAWRDSHLNSDGFEP
jgi:hypothetical protein